MDVVPPDYASTSSALPPTNAIHHTHRTPGMLLLWYWVLIIGGQILLPVLLVTMVLSRNVRRDPTLISMIVSWIMFTVIMCLLYYAGYESGPEPPFGLCVTQASMVYAAPVMSCAAGLALVVQVFFGLRNLTSKMVTKGRITASEEKDFHRRSKWRTVALVTSPYILFVAFSIGSAVVGVNNRQGVSRHRSFFFCSIDTNLYIIVGWISAILSTITVFFEGWIAYMFYRNWSEITLPQTRTAFNVRIIVRVIGFSVYSGVCWLSFMISGTEFDIIPWILTACVPLVAFLVFGTQLSILRVWAFWVPRKPRPECEPDNEEVDCKADFYSMTPVTMSKATLVPLPPRAHGNPFMNDEEITANSSRGSLFPLKLDNNSTSVFSSSETAYTLSPRTFKTSYAGSPVTMTPSSAERDVYGWERCALEARKR